MSTILPNLAIAGYRSFGPDVQYFEAFRKINIFIGQNNCGKSNVLRFLEDVCSKVGDRSPLKLDPLAQHLPGRPPLILGTGESIDRREPKHPRLPMTHRMVAVSREGWASDDRKFVADILGKLFAAKAEIDKTSLCWSLITLPDRRSIMDTWREAFRSLSDWEVERLWRMFTDRRGGNRPGAWEPQLLEIIPATPGSIEVAMIPAIRKIGAKGSPAKGFDGSGIIENIAKLQNPDVHNQSDRERFSAITRFLREVTDRPNASIEIPYERDTILVHMDGKVLPIESLGSGIHEVCILAAAATVLSENVVCIEEPELHLNPILQRKLIRYLSSETTNQYFITTHSAALMDTPDAEVYHIRLQGDCSLVERVTSDVHRSAVCEDLGYHPSDLLQANCVIWVEGPSDRIYLTWWLRAMDPSLIEGIHYGVMFYGGRLAAHLSYAGDDKEVDEFISLRRLNRRGVMIIDSDRDRARKPINATKRRLQREFDSGPGHAWITMGREIENYLAFDQIKAALSAIEPDVVTKGTFGRFENCLSFRGHKGGGKAPKVEIARHITSKFAPDFAVLDLRQRLERLCRFIRESNPKL